MSHKQHDGRQRRCGVVVTTPVWLRMRCRRRCVLMRATSSAFADRCGHDDAVVTVHSTSVVKTDDRRPTTDDRQPTTDDRRPTTDDRRPTTDDRRQTTDDRRPATDDVGVRAAEGVSEAQRRNVRPCCVTV